LLHVQSLIVADKVNIERDKRDTQSYYTGSFHNWEVVLPPLNFQWAFTKISIWLQMLKHTSKRLQILKHTRKRFPMFKHKSKQETS